MSRTVLSDKPISRPLSLDGIAWWLERILRPYLIGLPLVGDWQTFTPVFESIFIITEFPGGPEITITGSSPDPGGHQIDIAIVVDGGRGTGHFAWILEGVPIEIDVVIPSDGVYPLATTGYVANFAVGDYPLFASYTFNLHSTVLGDGTITGRWRSLGDDIEVEVLLVVGTTTDFGTGRLRFPMPDGLVINAGGLLDGEQTSWPYRMIPVLITTKTSTSTLNGFTYPLQVDDEDNLFFESSLTATLNPGDQVLFRAVIPAVPQ